MLSEWISVLLFLARFMIKGLLINVVILLRFLITYPLYVGIVAILSFLLYRFFLHMGFNQKRSIGLSSAYLDGQYYIDQLQQGTIQDPHTFYNLERAVLSRPLYCSVCQLVIPRLDNDGVCCDVCGYTTHIHCLPKVSGECKAISMFPSSQAASEYVEYMRTPASTSSSSSSSSSSSQVSSSRHTSTSIPIIPSSDVEPSHTQEKTTNKRRGKIVHNNDTQQHKQSIEEPYQRRSTRSSSRSRKHALSNHDYSDITTPLFDTLHVDKDMDSSIPPPATTATTTMRTRRSSTYKSRHASDTLPDMELSTETLPSPLPPLPTLPYTLSSSSPFSTSASPLDLYATHHWVTGNHSSISDFCFICGGAVGSLLNASGMRCLWCHNHVHHECLVSLNDVPSQSSSPSESSFFDWSIGGSSCTDDTHTTTAMTASSHHHNNNTIIPTTPRGKQRHYSTTTSPSSPSSPFLNRVPSARSLPHLGSSNSGPSPDARYCHFGPLSQGIIPPHCVYPGPSYTHASARLAIATQFTHTSLRARATRDYIELLALEEAEKKEDHDKQQTSSSRRGTKQLQQQQQQGSSSDQQQYHHLSSDEYERRQLIRSRAATPYPIYLDFPQIYTFDIPSWSYPLLIFINRRSGANTGVELLHDFVDLLNPIQIWDLGTYPAELPLSLFKNHVRHFRILVCGGDGTISLTLQAIDRIFGFLPTTLHHLDPQFTHPQYNHTSTNSNTSNNTIHNNNKASPPLVAILPLGTGNDLAQILGWGKYSPTHIGKTAQHVLHEVLNARATVLDRWDVKITPLPHDPIQLPPPPPPTLIWRICDKICQIISPLSQSLEPIFPVFCPPVESTNVANSAIMNNYIGFGLDAVIAHHFATLRDNYPNLFKSQFGNKLWYTRIGFGQWLYPVIRGGIKASPFITRVYVDGIELKNISHLQGICCLGIKSFGGGICFWGDKPMGENTSETDATSNGRFQPPALDDGLFELIGFESSMHMAMIQTGQSMPHRLAQGRRLVVEVLGHLPLQIDGEPFGIRSNSRIEVTLRTQSLMLTPSHDGPTQHSDTRFAGISSLSSSSSLLANPTYMLQDVMRRQTDRGVLSSMQSSMILADFAKTFSKLYPASYFYEPTGHGQYSS